VTRVVNDLQVVASAKQAAVQARDEESTARPLGLLAQPCFVT
jgi:hypothetical protein